MNYRRKLKALAAEQDELLLDKEVASLKDMLVMASLEMFKEREYMIQNKGGERESSGSRPGKRGKESIFSTNYAANIPEEYRATAGRKTVAPVQNTSVKKTSAYCTLI